MVSRFSNETLTVLLEDLRSNLKEVGKEIKNVNDKITILSKGQSLLGGTYHELQDVCQKRWERFEQLEEDIKKKQEMEKELKKSQLFYWIHKNKKLIVTVIPWILIISIALFALITNNSDLLKVVAEKIHI